ncbi:hypothetical protein HK105_203250 [Polyrhizophydium stewartii]|uniref:Uncharacterized protein n=1 Tax=Polyrhizophydium stewartii TaxID=2732419 RepID=A0ABR4NCE1_9FUNG
MSQLNLNVLFDGLTAPAITEEALEAGYTAMDVARLTTIALAAVASASLPLAAARFQNENDPAFKAILAEIHDSVCVGSKFNAGECPTAAGAAISTVLAAASACAQQDAADGFIDLANKGVTDTAKKARFIVLAQQFRAHERNSVPNPCSPICDRPPKNKQLLGIIQAQDPACKAIPALPAAQAQAIAANPAQVKANLAAVGQKAVNSGQTATGSGDAGSTTTTDSTDSTATTTRTGSKRKGKKGKGKGKGKKNKDEKGKGNKDKVNNGQFAFRCQNGKDAQAAKLRALGGSCTEGENVCLTNGQFGQCVGGKLVGTACAGGLSCQVLPLRNKSGTSVTCSTAADRTARIAEALQSC